MIAAGLGVELTTVQESFLHFVWNYQRYDHADLRSTQDLPIEIYKIGNHNTDAGPDFLNAKLSLAGIQWHGSVEIHVNSSDWNHHNHHLDEKYNNVILHVVWNHDVDCYRSDGEVLPVLELKNRVPIALIDRYKKLVYDPHEIPCQDQFSQVRDIDKLSMLDQMAIERLRRKSTLILDRLERNKGSWEETVYQLVAQSFGFKKNADSMLKLAEVLSHKVLLKQQTDRLDTEALLFGVAGFLDQTGLDEYAEKLTERYAYLSKKYRTGDFQMLRVEWNFLRMRPGNFPTVRLAELSAFIFAHAKFFHLILHHTSIKELRQLFEAELSPYWQVHYDFGKKSTRPHHGLGSASIDVLLINTVAPVLAAYSQYVGDELYMDRAVDLLHQLKAEKNRVIEAWQNMGMSAKTAFDSQALLELKNEFCLKKKCLSCKIGLKLISD
ncbi:DUF2851 family protein [Reichenbachiella agarivorans]|uniref:DUF2851 family protein n=1 Tax=Reichenbachiella agarivorans TaxID=2979464 RepID=A0ABY6CRM7_9BACT|nr:DUF2851 family protein [Reichenbachiella agarivorans]UXP33170.1 DUF2851 family protein [Reichenbachiella agarivorans]